MTATAGAATAPPGVAAVPAAVAPRATRWLGLDALRGLTIASMILVNNPGSWAAGWQYAPLRHAAWHGCTFTDLVFPTFLFVAGVAIVPALSRKLAAGVARGAIVRDVLRRVAVLCLLGVMLSAFPFVSVTDQGLSFDPLLEARLPGVLQRIGVCYGIAALLVLFASERAATRVLWACLLLYWPLLTLVPVPGAPPGVLPDLDDAASMLHVHVDRAVFGSHVWRYAPFDPEGVLSTVPALATCLSGVAAGRLLASDRPRPDVVRDLLLRGALLLAGGAVWGWFLPWNKQLWTSSYAVFTAGVATTGLALATWFADVRGWRRLLHPLQVYGVNALLVFVGSGLLARVVGRLWTVADGDGGRIPAQRWFVEHALLPWTEPKVASLLWALLWVGGWYGVLTLLWRRGIVWKV